MRVLGWPWWFDRRPPVHVVALLDDLIRAFCLSINKGSPQPSYSKDRARASWHHCKFMHLELEAYGTRTGTGQWRSVSACFALCLHLVVPFNRKCPSSNFLWNLKWYSSYLVVFQTLIWCHVWTTRIVFSKTRILDLTCFFYRSVLYLFLKNQYVYVHTLFGKMFFSIRKKS
jgi:hypothetical protein